MKVLFLERSLGRGGAQRQLVALAIGLLNKGHSVTVVLFYDEGELIQELVANQITVRIIQKKSRWDIVRFFGRIQRLLKAEQADILCTFLTVPNLVAIICNLISPKTRTVCGIRASNMELGMYDPLVRATYALEARLLRFADSIVSNSVAGCQWSIRKGILKTIRVIPNGIDTERFQLRCAERAVVRKDWQIRSCHVLIGIVGRLDPMKDHRLFFRAAGKIIDQEPDVRFVVVGDEGPILRTELMSFADGCGLKDRIVWSHGRDDMDAVFSACDILASSSAFGEGFSNTIAEAMSCGRRCVATDVGDARIILGTTGYISHAQDISSFADAMLRAIRDCRIYGHYSVEARHRIEANFSLDTMVKSFETEFYDVLAR